ncbi:MAG: hypothetical protein IJ124_06005 [Clostridia bacterium]|nr:hypothetical protein [Clostridia bacterium]
MLDELKTALEATGLPVAHFGWSTAPAAPYLVYGEDGANDLEAGNAHAERAVEGTVDLYTRDDTGRDIAVVESALEESGAAWYYASTQFETDTGLLHHEWVFQVV